jgi:serine protease inhibitor
MTPAYTAATKALGLSFRSVVIRAPDAIEPAFAQAQSDHVDVSLSADRADFSGIIKIKNDERLWIDKILRRAVIEVAEEGTEAAAVTAVPETMIVLAAVKPPKPVPFIVDRPFLFYIVDNATGAILFAGRIMDPGKMS